MIAKLERLAENREATAGLISLGSRPVCWSLEDQGRAGPKVAGETRISAGLYRVRVRTSGRTHARMRDRFGDWHRGVLELVGVPNFTAIQIHPGVDDDDTAGCILPGMSIDLAGRMRLGASTAAYRRLYEAVIDAALRGELEIKISDERCGQCLV